jgi:branched-chain amino acid transport system substrate-binding protein
VQFALNYVGGKAGVAHGQPITIGFVNQQGGLPSFPEASVAAQAAVKFINDQLGGVHGRPIQLQPCLIVSSEEQGQQCAEQFANNPGIKIVSPGTVSVGNASLHRILSGRKAYIGGIVQSPSDAVDKNSLFLSGGVFGIPPSATSYFSRVLKAKTVAIINSSDPQGQAAAALQRQQLEAAGIKVTQAPVSETASDLTAAFTAVGASSASAIELFIYPQLCVPAYKAIQQLGISTPVVAVSLCQDPSVKKALGDLPKGWTFMSPNPDVGPAATAPDARAYLAAMKAYAPADANPAGTAPMAFAAIMTDDKLLNELGPNTSTNALIKASLKFRGPGFLTAPDVACGTLNATPGLCTTQELFLTYEGNDRYNEAGGGWLPPTAFGK